jgi:hypothetical protein
VPRQFLEVLSGLNRQPFQNGSGRLELARAIASPDNPLTARVMVNRIWMHHFGVGLVKTPSDFGLRSEPPSHPELLDYLARRFIDDGWSIKNLHRLIMLSNTYQQASSDRADMRSADPDNRLLWRTTARRLDFEAMRDSLLFVSRQLDPTIGGRAVELTSRPFPRRRTLYGYIDRLNLPTMYRSFDFASPDAHSPQRFETMVPQQALFLMNHPFVMDQARQLVASPEFAAASSAEQRIGVLYRQVFARSPTSDEIALARPFAEAIANPPAMSPAVWSYGYISNKSDGTTAFASLPYFTNDVWHAGPQLPDLKCGWSTLTSNGGSVGRDKGLAVVRRWTAPIKGTLEIEGTIHHRGDAGDGIRARIVHSRLGELASWSLHKLEATCNVKGLQVESGDTIDFIVDGKDDPDKDDFTWAPTLRIESPREGGGEPIRQEWDAKREFAGPIEMPLSPWERYAHVLLQSNEFAVID